VLGAVGLTVYHFRAPLEVQLAPAIQNIESNITAILPQPAPCSEPIPYTLGTFDTRFGISKDYFICALGDAELLWDKALSKNLFTYVPDDKAADALKINLIYDYRQETTGKLSSLGIVVSDNKASYDSLKAKFTAEKAQYDTAKSDFDTEVSQFNTEQTAYETEVNYWNAQGGAPQAEYDKLQNEKAQLETLSAQLKSSEASLNALADEVNALAVALNRLVSVLNLSVANYNATIGTSPGESFEEGEYSSNGATKEIDIYEFSNRTKLVRALAHEMGHALGLDHVADPNAIMYKLNQGTTLALTADDISELKAKCGVK